MNESVETLTAADNGKTVELRVGDVLALRLRENAATGYRWSMDNLDDKLVTLSEERFVPESQAVGSGGDVQWTLKANAPGLTQVRLKRWRQWEGEASIQERFAVNLRIRS